MRLLVIVALAGLGAAVTPVTPVEKVVTLLTDLKTEVESEASAEAKTYDEFACFCKDTTGTKSGSIKSGQDAIDGLAASIQENTAKMAQKATDLGKQKKKREELGAELSEEQARCLKEMTEFEATLADLSKAVSSLDKAIKAMKSSKPTLLQLQAAIGDSLALADALGLVKAPKRREVAAFLQQGVDPEDPTYKYRSQGIMETLTTLHTDFDKQKTEAQGEWDKAKKNCNDVKLALTGEIETVDTSIGALEVEIDTLTSTLAGDRESLGSAESTLKDDQLYLKDLTDRCESGAKDWDQRSTARAEEVKLLGEALVILTEGGTGVGSNRSIQELDSAANVRALLQQRRGIALRKPQAPSFLQEQAGTVPAAAPRRQQEIRLIAGGGAVAQRARQVAELLRSQGTLLNSKSLSAMAVRVVSDPFAKVKTLIQGLIERLLTEATQEATKKGFCDEEIGKANQSRTFRWADVNTLTAELGVLKAKKDGLEVSIKTLQDAVTTLEDALNSTSVTRAAQKVENLETIKTAKEGVVVVGQAITLLEVWYKKAGRVTSLAQASPVDEDTTGPGFSGAYKGRQGGAKGIINLLEVIKSDFERTVRNTEKSEEEAAAAFVLFDRTSRADIKGKETKAELEGEELDATKTTIQKKMSDLDSAQTLLDAALKTIEDLKPMCIDMTMSFADRAAQREEEIAALKKAMCYLDPNKVESECQ